MSTLCPCTEFSSSTMASFEYLEKTHRFTFWNGTKVDGDRRLANLPRHDRLKGHYYGH